MAEAWAIVYASLNAAAFLAYGWDKWCARRGAWRVPEFQLHLLALAGGFGGAWLGMRLFHHKTQKRGFHFLLALAALAHAAGWGFYLLSG